MLQFRWLIREREFCTMDWDNRNVLVRNTIEERVLQMREWMPAMVDPDSGWMDVPTVREKGE